MFVTVGMTFKEDLKASLLEYMKSEIINELMIAVRPDLLTELKNEFKETLKQELLAEISADMNL